MDPELKKLQQNWYNSSIQSCIHKLRQGIEILHFGATGFQDFFTDFHGMRSAGNTVPNQFLSKRQEGILRMNFEKASALRLVRSIWKSDQLSTEVGSKINCESGIIILSVAELRCREKFPEGCSEKWNFIDFDSFFICWIDTAYNKRHILHGSDLQWSPWSIRQWCLGLRAQFLPGTWPRPLKMATMIAMENLSKRKKEQTDSVGFTLQW